MASHKLKLYEVRDGGGFVGAYYAKNEKHAVQRAQDEQDALAATFRKSFRPVMFKAPRAVEISAEAK